MYKMHRVLMTSKNTGFPKPLTGGLGRGIQLAYDSLFGPSFKTSNPFYFGSRNVVLVSFLKQLLEVKFLDKKYKWGFYSGCLLAEVSQRFHMGRW